MRVQRTVARSGGHALVLVVVAALLPALLPGSTAAASAEVAEISRVAATAAVVVPPSQWRRTSVPASDGIAAKRAKPARPLTAKAVQRGNRWFVQGRVGPRDGTVKTIVFKIRKSKRLGWRTYARVRTQSTGRYRVRLAFPRSAAPTWRYRGVVKGTSSYRRAETQRFLACRRASCL